MPSTESKLLENQHFGVGPTDDQMTILAAKRLLLRCERYVRAEGGPVERVLLDEIARFREEA